MQTLGDGACIASLAGSKARRAELLARVFQDKFHQCDCAKKLCAQDLSSGVQLLGDGTCIASLAGSETKRAALLARIFQHKFHQRDCPEKLMPKTSQKVSKCWAKERDVPDMHGKKFFAGGAAFILHGVLPVDAWFSLPLQGSKLNENPSIGYASACMDRWGNSLGRALLGGSEDLLHREACTQGGLYTQSLLHRETFTRERFYT